MTLEFKVSNAIVLAPPQLNPGVFNQAWMISHLRIDPDDFVDQGTIQLPVMFSATTRQFNLLVLHDRVQLTPAPQREEDRQGDMVRRVMGMVLGKFPDLPYTALGLNFSWTVQSPERRNRETSRRLFFATANPLFRIFDVEDACFGVFASKDILGFRLRVDARPVADKGDEPDASKVLFSFNFHQDLTGVNRVAQTEQLFGRWDAVKAEAFHIVQQVHAECGL